MREVDPLVGVRTPERASPDPHVAELEEELARLRAELERVSAAHRAASAEQKRLELRVCELGTALRQKHEEFLDMLDRLQDREEQAVQRAQEALERLATAIETSIDGIAIVGQNEQYLFLNDAHAKIYGYNSSVELRGRRWQVFSRADDLCRFDEEIVPTLQRMGRWRGEAIGVKLDGSTFPQEISLTRMEGGELVCVVRDISERKRTEEALRVSEEEQRFLAETSKVLGSSLDYRTTLESIARLSIPGLADYCIIEAVEEVAEAGKIHPLVIAHQDPARERLLAEHQRYAVESAAKSPVLKPLHTGKPELFPEITDAWLEVVARGPEHLGVLRELGPRSVMVVPLIARGRTLGLITFARTQSGRHYDAHDLALAEELAHRAALAITNARLYDAALVASRAKSDFLAVISHELRTPMNAIIGYAELLLMGVPDAIPDGSRRQVERVRSASRHLLQLIEEVLSFSRMEAGEEKLRLERTDLFEVIRDVVAMAEPLAQEKGLRFRPGAPDQPISLDTDPGKVRQILLNLLANAVKFTEQGEVELRAGVVDGIVHIQVRDTGVGIAPEDTEMIFEPFWQVEQPRTRRKGGTGLGLSVARRLARLMGGDLVVESTPGAGSTFTVWLPLRQPEQSSLG